MVTTAPSIDSMSRRAGMATISLAFSPTLAGGEGGHHVDGVLGSFVARAPGGLAVDGDEFDRRLHQRADPSHETPPERLSVERGENVAEVIVARRAVDEGEEAP